MSLENEQRYCLQVDVGNSSAKWRLVDSDRVSEAVARGQFVTSDDTSVQAFIESVGFPEQIWISSVASPDSEKALAKRLLASWGVDAWFAKTQVSTGGLINSYIEPERMGVDRWLAMLGARGRTTERLCVVDAGSALTIDIVAASGIHEGGYIIPGARLMERAILLDTDRVRFDQDIQYALSPGCSTAQAVRHGIALAQVGAVGQALKQLDGPAPKLFFTGGAGQQLMNLGGFESEWVPELVLDGLAKMAVLEGKTFLG